MTDLEKLINELCELPSIDLKGDEDTVEVRWSVKEHNCPLLILGGHSSIHLFLELTQVLALLNWLENQRNKLELLQDALQAQKALEESNREYQEAERLNALKALHSDAVAAWQQGGCEGPCPSFEDIVRKEQFIEVALPGPMTDAIPVTFVKQYPALGRMREGQRG